MKNIINKIFLVLMVSVLFVSCNGKTDNKTSDSNSNEKGIIITTTTPFLEDIVNILLKDVDANVEVKNVIPVGDDPHVHEALPEDLEKLASADLVLYHGLHFEGQMMQILEENDKSVSVSKNFVDSEIGEMEEDGNQIMDPHFWFDVNLYKKAVNVIEEELIKIIPDKQEKIKENNDKYMKALDEMASYAKEKIDAIPKERRILVTPHDAFNYFARYYNIEVKSPQGVSTESEVSVKDIEDTANFIVDKKISAIFVESTTSPERMEKLVEVCKKKGHDVIVVNDEKDQLLADSLAGKGEEGDTYIDMVKRDVRIITENLK